MEHVYSPPCHHLNKMCILACLLSCLLLSGLFAFILALLSSSFFVLVVVVVVVFLSGPFVLVLLGLFGYPGRVLNFSTRVLKFSTQPPTSVFDLNRAKNTPTEVLRTTNNGILSNENTTWLRDFWLISTYKKAPERLVEKPENSQPATFFFLQPATSFHCRVHKHSFICKGRGTSCMQEHLREVK